MSEPDRETPSEKLRMAFALIDVAERMLRQRLRRESPGMSDQVLEERVGAWYARRPGAEFGDGVGFRRRGLGAEPCFKGALSRSSPVCAASEPKTHGRGRNPRQSSHF